MPFSTPLYGLDDPSAEIKPLDFDKPSPKVRAQAGPASGVPMSFTVNRASRVFQWAMQYLRYQLGVRSRPSRPQEVSDRTVAAARELVDALLDERP